MTFGEKLQKLRARAGLSQDALAELLDVSRQAVSKWERDEAMPEAEKIVRISRQFGVSTDYLLLEEQEEPATASAPAPAAGLWVRVKQWCQNRGYLLAWALAAWGIWRLGVIVVSLIRSYLTLDKIPGFNLERYLVNLFVPEIASAALLMLTAVVLALLGRRLAGHLRWYHLGWLPVLAGLFGTYWHFSLPLLSSLSNGLVWELTGKVIDAVRGERLITESMQARSHIDFTALLVTIFGLAILLLGRRHERKRTPTKME